MIISIKESRKILGKEISGKMTDSQIENTVLLLSNIANEFIHRAQTDPIWRKEIKELAKSKSRETKTSDV